jgi:hypothetical protein
LHSQSHPRPCPSLDRIQLAGADADADPHPIPVASDAITPEKLPILQKLAGIGNLNLPISSKNSETNTWFDLGINLVFDFWDNEANLALEMAIRTDLSRREYHSARGRRSVQ